ncbi:MAG: hypothetical protein ABIF19_09075 [Planctomycetota bacterium]
MQGVTLTFALFVSLLVITLRPKHALAAYITGLLWYPSFLAVSVGSIDIVVGRFVVAVLLLRCLCNDEIRSRFIWCRLDTLVTLSMVVYVSTYFVTLAQPLSSILENRGGFLMDTWCAYIAARFIVTDRTKLISVMKCISLVLVPLAILGVIESIFGWQPFAPLRRFSPWFAGGVLVSEQRFGFARAVGPFSHAILFGGGFAMFLPLIYYLRHEKGEWRSWAYLLSGVALLGALSSMSSGPWVMVLVATSCLMMERYRKRLKLLFMFLVLSCIMIGIASNRPFYHVAVSWANPLGGAGYHRAKLIDLAIEHFDEWWKVGYGDTDPGWGPDLGMAKTDVTNEFILNGVKYGILGVVVIVLVLATAFRNVVATYGKVSQPSAKSLCWAFGSLLFSVTVAWMSVSFFGQLMTLFYCSLGMIGSLTHSHFNWEMPDAVLQAQNSPSRAVC